MYVTEVEPHQVETCEPYVLFYRKQQRQMPSIRARAVELMAHKEKSLMQFIISKQWINRFNTFAEPGCITNEDFLCAHGGVYDVSGYEIDSIPRWQVATPLRI